MINCYIKISEFKTLNNFMNELGHYCKTLKNVTYTAFYDDEDEEKILYWDVDFQINKRDIPEIKATINELSHELIDYQIG